METALERWQKIVQTRAAQMDTAYAHLGRSSADFWERRARGFHRATRERANSDPFYLHVREVLTRQATLLDVGAGTGRFSIAFAPLVEQVIALEPSAPMLNFLHEELNARGITNVQTLQMAWEEAPADLHADFVICSHVLYPLLEIEPFLQKLNIASMHACYLYLRATHIDALTAPLWRHFHGEERCLPPCYIHVLDVLFEMGIYAQVQVVRLPFALSYPSLQDAEDELIEQLILEDRIETRRELKRLLEDWLVSDETGWHSPSQEMVSAIIWWTN